MSIVNFTPVPALVGGLLIGASAVLLLYGSGRIAGISGILSGTLGRLPEGDRSWRMYFLVGLVLGGLIYQVVAGPFGPILTRVNELWPAMLGALLVGFGTRMGNGCTSGHGVCGVSRFSARSMAATMTFMAFGFLTVYVVRHVIGGG